MSLRLYSAAELTTLLREGGFGDCQVYGDLKGSPYDQAARRMVPAGKDPRLHIVENAGRVAANLQNREARITRSGPVDVFA